MKYDQARHQHWQRVLDTALTTQHITTLQTEDREELAYNLADATAAGPTWPNVHAALLRELTHRGVGEDHGTQAVNALADVLLLAIQGDPEPPAGAYKTSAREWLARWREDRATRRGRWYTPEPWGEDVEADHRVLRAVMEALRPWAAQLQTDLPMASRGQWPAGVTAAADHLLAVSPRRRGDSADYATTGWLPAGDDVTWSAYVTFAPYALNSDVLSAQAGGLIGVSDEGTSIALRLDAKQRASVLTVIGGRHLRRLR